MKTKIIYISGGELFNPADIRTAFDEVRIALGLDKDTLIFGVPVDEEEIAIAPESVMPAEPAIATEEKPAIAAEEAPPSKIIEFPTAAAKPKPKRTKNEAAPKPKAKAGETAAPVETAKPANSKPSPILSVIGVVSETNPEPQPALDDPSAQSAAAAGIPEPVAAAEIPEDIPESIPEAAATPQTPEVIVTMESIEISETVVELDASAPLNSIEDIFEGLEPLAEDERPNLTTPTPKAVEDPVPADGDEDATLSKLASEFMKTQIDDDAPAPRAMSNRINKLKNVLPFKKKESAEPSLLGDLFGWAGVAANDTADNFSMPDFFQVGNR